ncbi:MAG: hypothetical protein ACYCQK_08025 [Acidiferrobacteraceae bacterium]
MRSRCLALLSVASAMLSTALWAQTIRVDLGQAWSLDSDGLHGAGRSIACDLLDRFMPDGRDILSFVSQRLLVRGAVPGGAIMQEESRSEGIEAIWQFMWPVTYRWHPWVGGGVGYLKEQSVNRYLIERAGYVVLPLPDEPRSGPVVVAAIDVARRYGTRLEFGVDVRGERQTVAGRWVWTLSLSVGY